MSRQYWHSSYCCYKLFPSQRHTMQVFWAGMKIECFHSDGTITPLTAREKCSIQASRITRKLHETSYGASHDIFVDGVRLEPVLPWTNESLTSLHQADICHCLKRSVITVQWQLNCCYCFLSRMMHRSPFDWACVSRQRALLSRASPDLFSSLYLFFFLADVAFQTAHLEP